MKTITREISFPSGKYTLLGYTRHPESSGLLPGVLFIHGGGRYDFNIYDSWQEYLSKYGISSMMFFHRGVHRSEGVFEKSSLTTRREDAINAFRFFRNQVFLDPNRICMIGSSMGAHVAVRLVEGNFGKIKALMLQSAACYSREAESLNFNENFTREIRRDKSWTDSPVFEILDKFPGGKMIVYGEHDEVIPDGIKDRYAKSAGPDGLYIIKNGSHNLLRPRTQSGILARDGLFRKSVQFVNNHL